MSPRDEAKWANFLLWASGVRKALRGEWNIRANEKPTSSTAKIQAALFMGRIHMEWRREKREMGL